MNVVDVKEIESVIICFDWERMVIPKEYVKRLEYEDNKYVMLEVDLNYIKTHKYFMGNNFEYYKNNNIESDSDLTIWERLKDRDVWDLDVIYKDKKLQIELPSNRKDYYCHKSQYLIPWDAPNEWEVHSTSNGVFKMTWSKNDVYMNEEELRLFLANDNLSEFPLFSIKLVENILKDNISRDLRKLQSKEKHKKINKIEVNDVTLKRGVHVNVVIVTNEEEKDKLYKVISEDYWVLIINDEIKDNKFNNFDNVVVISYKDFNKMWLEFKDGDLI